MTNRREFLQIGVTATAWPLVARTIQATGLEPRPELVAAVAGRLRHPLRLRVSPSPNAAPRWACARCAIDADMTQLWYDEIYHRWKEGPPAIAGLTAHGPMFCFAELARDVRMRLVFRAEHRSSATDGSAAHAHQRT